MACTPTNSENSHTFIGLVNRNGILREANRSCPRFIATESTQVLGKPFWESRWYSHETACVNQLKNALKLGLRGQYSRFQIEHTDVDGNTTFGDFSLSPIYGENNTVTSLVIKLSDTDKALRTQETAIDLEESMAPRSELSTDLEQNEYLNYPKISPNAKCLVGAHLESNFEQYCSVSLPTSIAEPMRCQYRAAGTQETVMHDSWSYLQASGAAMENPVVNHSTQFEVEVDPQNNVHLGITKAGRLDSIDPLARGVIHDFNNLLAIVSANLELAAKYVTHSEASAILAETLKSVETGINLNQRLFARDEKQPCSAVRLSVDACLTEFVQLLKRTIAKNILITTDVDKNLWDVFASPSEFQDAFINLAVNARDAMPRGGTLHIKLSNLVLADGDTTLSAEATPGEYVGIFVSDTGIGMTQEVMQNALEPFFTTKEPGKGTGLGLCGVWGFVKASGGFLKYYSQVGKGTTVQLYLPRNNSKLHYN